LSNYNALPASVIIIGLTKTSAKWSGSLSSINIASGAENILSTRKPRNNLLV